MEIIRDLLTVNEWSRPGKELAKLKSIILHWTGNPNSSAKENRDFFESRKNGKLEYGSAQYIIGIEGEIILCIPENELAYHCGSSQIDPASKKIYTDWARSKFGSYATEKSSPNNVTIGIELCVIDEEGHYDKRTLGSAIDLVADICKRKNITIEDVGTHNMVVGWKDCPRLWTKHPELFIEFKDSVKSKI